LVIATGSRETARRDALAAGLDPMMTLTKSDLTHRLGDHRRRAHELGIRTMAIHSADWSRQPFAQFYELAGTRLALSECRIIGRGGVSEERISRSALCARMGSLPLEAAGALGISAAEWAHFRRISRGNVSRRSGVAITPGDVVLALWLGSAPGTEVGGAVTHVRGVLGGFREAGMRVALVAMSEPPPRILAAIDELICVPPMPRRARITAELAAVAGNRFARQAAESAVSRLRPAFIYQRYDAFVTCGVELGERAGIPVVLEWNNSVVWQHHNWHATHPFKRPFMPLLEAEERYVATRADVLAAVSDQAAAMARAAGAPAERVVIVPNAVDFGEIDAGRALAVARGKGPSVGWVGSFGVWHGAEVLVKAMSLLPPHVRAVMIGDGSQRDSCEELARRLGVWERIEWTGSLPHITAVRRLSECDVLACPHVPLQGGQSFFGSPTKIFEYMAIGRPIVASALEQLAEVLEDGETARLVPAGDVVALARGIERVLEQPDDGRRLGDSARARAWREHTWDRRARTILDHVAA
jgi:glycosyltransferase involved in cell wall biosynthesis